MVPRRLGIDEQVSDLYSEREETRREHLSELRAFLGVTLLAYGSFISLLDG